MTSRWSDGSTDPNRNALWGRAIIEELVAAGVIELCHAPGSRSTPIVLAAHSNPSISLRTIIDERTAGFFALGRAAVTGHPTPVLTTSGTAAANLHPAVIEAAHARVPMLVLTADRPPELRDSEANQTINQVGLYGSAIRWAADLPEPAPQPRRLRALRTAVARAVAICRAVPPGPVHLNVPFAKPLESSEVPGDIPADLEDRDPRAVTATTDGYLRMYEGRSTLDPADVDTLVDRMQATSRGLFVVGPSTDIPFGALTTLASTIGYPVFADPLSGGRFGPHIDATAAVVGGYDGWLVPTIREQLAGPDLVIRFGRPPTSDRLRSYLAAADPEHIVVDPAGPMGDPEFATTTVLACDPRTLIEQLPSRVRGGTATTWTATIESIESAYWSVIAADTTDTHEDAILSTVLGELPPSATLVIGNSMPVRDLDRFGRPESTDTTVIGNRGASGIDGVLSTTFGVASATDRPTVAVVGDLAFHHDATALSLANSHDIDATIVLINNDGGGIFHLLPIEAYDPPFTERFRAAHGRTFEDICSQFDVAYDQQPAGSDGADGIRRAFETAGPAVIEILVDGEASHRHRESLDETVATALTDLDLIG